MALLNRALTSFSIHPFLLHSQRLMDNQPKDSSSGRSPNRDGNSPRREGRSPERASSGDQEAGGSPPPPPTQQQEAGGAAPTEAGGGQERRATRVVQVEGGGDGPGQRSRGVKRSRPGDEGAGPSGAKSRKKPQEFDAPDVASPCSVCGRRFGSWKALFGHMRSHPEREWRGIHPPPRFNREGTPEGPEEDPEAAREQAEHLLLGVAQEVAARFGAAPEPETGGVGQKTGDKGEKTATETGHRCSICSRVFSSGPALGGHMRTHSDKQDQAAASSSPAPRRRGLDIDLNEPQEPADDEPQRSSSSSPPPPPQEGRLDLNMPPPQSDDE